MAIFERLKDFYELNSLPMEDNQGGSEATLNRALKLLCHALVLGLYTNETTF